jgi:hypothetical protein
MPNIIDVDQLLYRAEECRVLAAIVTDETANRFSTKRSRAHKRRTMLWVTEWEVILLCAAAGCLSWGIALMAG